ncbi:MAG: hypothetical protein RL141_853 [Candidatus Parcubacteria bacterium]
MMALGIVVYITKGSSRLMGGGGAGKTTFVEDIKNPS